MCINFVIFFNYFLVDQSSGDQGHHLYYEKSIPDVPGALEYDGVPFLIAGRRIYECHQGERRKKPKEEQSVSRLHN